VLAVAVQGASSTSWGFCRTTTSGRQPAFDQCATEGVALRWSSSCAALSLDTTTLPPGWTRIQLDAELQRGVDRWNVVQCGSAPYADGGSDADSPRFALVRTIDCADGARFTRGQRHSNTISFRAEWADSESFPPGVIAATLVSYDVNTGEILDADIAFNLASARNPEGFVFVTEPSSDPAARDFAAVYTHELGHVLGLAHSDDHSALMFASYDRVSPRRELRDDDRRAACAVYPAGSGSALCEPLRDHRCEPGCHCSTVGTSRARPDHRGWSVVALLVATVSAMRCERSRRRPGRES
jgi:hypothetical protein